LRRSDITVKKIAIALMFAGISAVGASAADLPAKIYSKAPAVAAPAYDWSGFYVGANMGADWQDASFTSNVVGCEVLGCGTGTGHIGSDAAVGPAGTGSKNALGFTGGGQIGVNWQVNSLVIGAEADINALSGKPKIGPGPFQLAEGGTFTLANAASANWLATVRGRVGFAADRILVYVTGGAAFANMNFSQSYSDDLGGSSTPLTNFSISSTKTGYAAGAGLEYAVTNNWSVRGEYLYAAGFSALGGSYLPIATTGNSDLHSGSAKLNISLARFGLNYKFGGPFVANNR
jgi:outer membrane immunogenic protein